MIELGITLGLILIGWFAGTAIEKRHFRSIHQGEEALKSLLLITSKKPPQGTELVDEGLVFASCVISVDYFKRTLAGFRALVGGGIGVYETLIERARREAILRVKEKAKHLGADMIINVRFETSRVFSTGSATISVEVTAYGTPVRQKNG